MNAGVNGRLIYTNTGEYYSLLDEACHEFSTQSEPKGNEPRMDDDE